MLREYKGNKDWVYMYIYIVFWVFFFKNFCFRIDVLNIGRNGKIMID